MLTTNDIRFKVPKEDAITIGSNQDYSFKNQPL